MNDGVVCINGQDGEQLNAVVLSVKVEVRILMFIEVGGFGEQV